MASSKRKARSHTTPVKRKPSLDFSVTGLVFSTMMMFMGLAAINSQANLLFGVFGLMIGVLTVSWWISRAVLRRLVMERRFPEQMTVGQRATITYHFRNEKRFWPSLSVCLGELEGNEAFTRQVFSYMLHVAGGQSAVVPVDVMPRRRGLHQFERYQLSTSFPFGFIKRAIERRQKDQVLVFPAMARVDQKVLLMCRAADKTGAMMRPRRGGVDEVYGVKEYRAGDNPRWINWRRSARTGQLVVKEMTQVSPPRLVLLVDSYLQDRSLDSYAAVERTIARAASLASMALEQGLMVGLLAWNNGWHGVPPGRGKRHRRDLLAELARLPLNTTHPTPLLLDSSFEVLESGTTPVLLTPQDIYVGIAEHLRSGMLAIADRSEQARRWFQFDSSIEFRHCMPSEQEPTDEQKRQARRIRLEKQKQKGQSRKAAVS